MRHHGLSACMLGIIIGFGSCFPALAVDFDAALFEVDRWLASSGGAATLQARDNDGNGIWEEDQLGLLGTILAGGEGVAALDSSMRSEIASGYASNQAQVRTDLTVSVFLMGQINLLDELGETEPAVADALGIVLAGLMTVADTSTLAFVNALADTLVEIYLTQMGQTGYIDNVQGQISFIAGNYETFGEAPSEENYFGAQGDIDADGTTNGAEYLEGTEPVSREIWLSRNNVTPPLRIISVAGGGLRLTGLSETFSVIVAGGGENPTFEWRKGDTTTFTVQATTAEYGIGFLNTTDSGHYYCVVNDGVTQRITPSLQLSVYAADLSFTRQPQGATKQTGQTHTFSVAVQGGEGPGPYQYTWMRDGEAVGPNAPEWTLDPITVPDAGRYTVRVTSNGGTDAITSDGAVLTVQAPPLNFVSHPQAAAVYTGDAYTLTVEVEGGSGSYAFDWRKNGLSLGVESAASLLLDPITLPMAGSYDCVITDTLVAGLAVTSETAQIDVQDPIVITTQPEGDNNLYVGETFRMEVAAQGGYPPLTYQWKWNNLNLVGRTTPVYETTALSGFSGAYTCQICDAHTMCVTSDAATLRVLALGEIREHPQGGSYYVGASHTFTIDVQGGTGTLSYDWKKEGISLGAPSQASLTLSGLQLADAGSYSCTVTDEGELQVDSESAMLYVGAPPAIIQQPQGNRLYTGDAHLFSFGVSNGVEPITYQWTVDGVAIEGATAATYDPGVLTEAMSGEYACRFEDGQGTVLQSDTVTLEVAGQLVLVQPPLNSYAYIGQSHELVVEIQGGLGTVLFEWSRDDQLLMTTPSNVLNFNQVSPYDAGVYTCHVYDEGSGSFNIPAVNLQIAPALVLETQPQGGVFAAGQAHKLLIEATGGFAPVTYQWYKDSVALPGYTLPSINFGALALFDSGTYLCVVRDGVGTELPSLEADITVFEPVTIIQQPQGVDTYTGESYEMRVVVSGGLGDIHYNWQKNFASLEAEDAPALTFESLTEEDAGAYNCLISDETGTRSTETVSIRLAAPLTFTQQPLSTTQYIGGRHVLELDTTGGFYPLTYTWRKNGVVLPEITGRSITFEQLTEEDAGQYACTIHDAATAVAVSQTAEIIVATPIEIDAHPVSIQRYVGESHSFTITASGGLGVLHYDWQKDGQSLSAPDQNHLDLSDLTINDAGEYRCVVTDDGTQQAFSETARLNVGKTLTIDAQPQDTYAYVGDMHSFYAQVSGGIGTLQYQWMWNGTAETGATAPLYQFGPLTTAHTGSYTCRIEDESEVVVTTEPAVLTVCDRISILRQPEGGSYYRDASHTFSITARGGAGTFHYDWRKNGVSLGAEDSDTLTLTKMTADDSGVYSCEVSDDHTDKRISDSAILSVADTLTAYKHPEGAHLAVGDTHTFSFQIIGGIPPLSYRWYRNGFAIPGATQESYTIQTVRADDGGSYHCEVRDERGDVAVSEQALLTIMYISQQPQGASRGLGESHTFEIALNGAIGEVEYQWRKEGVAVEGATQSSYTLNELAETDSGTYACWVRDAAGAALLSDEVFLQVAEQPIAFSEEPQDAAVYIGAAHTFRVVLAAGPSERTYQWQRNLGAGFINITGATESTYTTPALTKDDSGQYRCWVTAGEQEAASRAATLTVTSGLLITKQPQSAMRYTGETILLSVEATGGYGTLKYEWSRDDVVVGEDDSVLQIANLLVEDAGVYRCRISDSTDSVVTAAATLQIAEPLEITLQPAAGDHSIGEDHLFEIQTRGGIPPVTYQWRQDGEALSGGNVRLLELTDLAPEDQGVYTCVVRDARATQRTSQSAVLQVFASLTITEQPQGGVAYLGESKVFSISARGGSGALHYLWRRNGRPVGGDQPTYTITSVQATDEGEYTCQVVDQNRSIMSDGATLSIASPMQIQEQPQGAQKYVGDSHQLQVIVAGGVEPLSYAWYKDGQRIQNAYSPAILLEDLTTVYTGEYNCVITDAADTPLNSDIVRVEVGAPMRVTSSYQRILKRTGESLQIQIAVSGGVGALSYTWYHDDAVVARTSSFTLNALATADSGAYRCVVQDALSEIDAGVLFDLFVGEDLHIDEQPQSAAMLSGVPYTLRVEAYGVGNMTYKWQKDGVTIYEVQNDPELYIPRLALSDAGAYRCIISDENQDVVYSATAVLNVRYQPLRIVRQPQGGSVAPKFAYTFEVHVEGGSGPLHYQWKKDEANCWDSPDASVYTLYPIVSEDAGTYTCEISDDFSTLTTLPAVLETDAEAPALAPLMLGLCTVLLLLLGMRRTQKKQG